MPMVEANTHILEAKPVATVSDLRERLLLEHVGQNATVTPNSMKAALKSLTIRRF